jgi:hypothetical protein
VVTKIVKNRSAQKSEIWDRWQRGESMRLIGRGFDRSSSSIYPLLARTGGIRPLVRIRYYLTLTLAEREEISRGLIAKVSLRSIGRDLKRSVSTISRAVKHNGGSAGYLTTASDQVAWDCALRPKTCKLTCHPFLAQAVSAKLRRKWSPEQIAGWLKRAFPEVVLSRLRSGLSTHLCGLSFECQGAFAAQR